MQKAGGAEFVPELHDLGNGVYRAGLVVHLHDAQQVKTLFKRAFYRVKLHAAQGVHGQIDHLCAFRFQPLGAGEHRGVFHGGDRRADAASVLPEAAEEGEVVGICAPGGKNHPVFPGAQRF